MSSPSFLGRAEKIPVKKANTVLLSDSSIAQCFGQIWLAIFAFVQNLMQHQRLYFLNRISDEQDRGVEAVWYESHILTANRTEDDIGCASITIEAQGNQRQGWNVRETFGCAAKKSVWSAVKLARTTV